MENANSKKLILLYIIDIFKKYSDENHPITSAFICEKLEEKGIVSERKSIYNYIAILIDYGYDIVKVSSKFGFFLGERFFEKPEIYLLTDAVRSAKFISTKKTNTILNKLDSLLSKYEIAERENKIFFDSGTKCDNEEIYYIIDIISDAINKKKQITFMYSKLELNNDQTIKKNSKQMTVSPYALTWQNEFYYLICNYEKYDNLLHLRLDRMSATRITKKPLRHFSEVSEYKDYFDTADYTKKIFDMYSGTLEKVKLKCSKKILDQVYDKFSNNIFITEISENDFCFYCDVVISEALITWILNYSDKIKVISPESLKNRVCDRAITVLNQYN